MGFILREQKGSKLTIQEMDGNLEFLYNLDQLKLFKPGSFGEKVSFVKVSGTNPATNKDVIIPGELEITRGNSGKGIYNIALESSYDDSSYLSPLNTQWNTQYLDPTNKTWAPLWDIQNRTFDTWRNAIETPTGSPAPPMYVGMPAVMKWDNGDDDPRYWLIMFTHWGVGNDNQYGFAYDRYEILNGVFFEQPSADNTNTPQVIDIISDNVQITRSYEGGALYNPLFESENANGASPANTRWNSEFTDSRTGYSGFNDLSNLESRVYTSFVHALDENVGNNLPGTDLIMHDITTDLYYKVEFDTWAQGCGGGNPGSIQNYDITNPGSGYPDGGYYSVTPTGGSGTNLIISIFVSGGVPTDISLNDNNQNYQVGDIITLTYPGVTDPTTIEVTEICSMGGFAYTRTVIPQSNGIKFADGTVLNTASTGGGGSTTSPITIENGSSLFSTGLTDTGLNSIAENSNFFGKDAGYEATNASYSNFLGYQAGYQVTGYPEYEGPGFVSNFLGYQAGYQATGATNSNFLGQNAGRGATDAASSNFIGPFAGFGATGASQSNFFGDGAGYQASGATNSNFLGSSAGSQATNAGESNFFGPNAGNNATDASNSNFFGNNAGRDAISANSSNFFGDGAGQNSSGNNVNAFGTSAGDSNTLDGQTIFSNTSMPTFADHTAAAAAITVLLGASTGSTYLYHNQATDSIGAVRL